MSFKERDGLRYFTFDSLAEAGLANAIFTRRGGISPAQWSSLNLGATVGDEAAHVSENRRRAFMAFGRQVESLFDVWQVHSSEVVCAEAPRPLQQPHIKADAILTNRSEVTLYMRFADCSPILLFDPRRGVAGLVHAGWLGTVIKVVRAAVETMDRQYGSKPADLLCAIGPSIAAHHYPVGEEVVARVRAAFGAEAASLLPRDNGAVQFDLWEANRLLLEQCGVGHIEVAGICTACHLEDWYSHRGEHGKTGRFGALVALGDGQSPF